MKLFNKMRNTGIALLGGLALLSYSSVLVSCSENVENGLYAADDSKINISINPVNESDNYHNGLLKIGSAKSSTVFAVKSTTRWIVEVTNCEGSWCQIIYNSTESEAGGYIGEGSFTIDAAPNRSDNERECDITVYAIESDGTHIPGKSIEIHLEQDRQSIQVEYAGDVISSIGTSSGAEPIVTVIANQAWIVSSSHSWVKIIPGNGMEGDSYTPQDGSTEERTISFRFSVDGNPGTSIRYAEVTISSPSDAFTPHRLNITQEGSSDTFFITPTELSQVPYSGDTYDVQVYSPRESWSVRIIQEGDWVTLDRTSGEASSDPVTIRASIATNNSTSVRQASLVFTRVGTDDVTVVRIDQKANSVVMDPDDSPKVSQPWLGRGWTATYATVYAYYSSPSVPIDKAMIAYRNMDNLDDYTEVSATVGDDNLISAELTNLKPNTRYEVWAFVEYTHNGMTMGTTGNPMSFTTPDLNGDPDSGLPGEDDNNPPSVN